VSFCYSIGENPIGLSTAAGQVNIHIKSIQQYRKAAAVPHRRRSTAALLLISRFFEFTVGNLVLCTINRSVLACLSTSELATISIFRGRLQLWLGQVTSHQWYYASSMFLLLFKSADASILTT